MAASRWMQAVFYGVGAAVIGIIAMSAYKLTTKNIGKDRLLWAIFLVSAAVTVVTKSEIVWLFLGAGVLVWLVARAAEVGCRGGDRERRRRPARWRSSPSTALDWHMLGQIGAFFAKAGGFVFGSGLAIVPFLYGGVVKEHHWLTERQFVDAVAVAMITPGPVVITVGFHRLPGRGLLGRGGRRARALSCPATCSPSCRRPTSRSTASAPASWPSSTA